MSDTATKIQLNPKEILANLPGHVYWVSKEGIMLGCNEQQSASLGFKSPQETIGKSIFDLYPKEEAEIIYKNNQHVIKTKQPIFIEEPASYRKEGETYLSYKAPLYDDEKNIIGIVGVSFDMTQKPLKSIS